MKKILVIVDSIDVNDSSGSKTNVAFINSLYKCGYEVTVLHYTQRDIKLNNINCISIKEKKITLNYLFSRAHRLLLRWFQLDISKYVDSIFGFSFGFFNDVYSLSTALKKFNPNDFDMLWTFGKGTSFRAHAAVLKNPTWFQIWHAYVHDPYPQHLYPRPYNFVEYGFMQKRLFFRDITENAFRIIFPSLLLKEWMQSYFKDVIGKSLIIPHQIMEHESNKISFPPFFNSSNFNILLAGNLLDLRNPLPLVEAYKKFIEEIPQAKIKSTLIIIGKNSIYNNALKNEQQYIPQLYISDGHMNFDEVYYLQQNASVNIILEATSEISPFLPGKFPHCVAANKPILVIGPFISECKRLLGKDYPFIFENEDIEGIKNAFKTLFHQWSINNTKMTLHRKDLDYYLSSGYLLEVLEKDLKS